MHYNWQLADWPQFRYDLTELEDPLYQFATRQGHISGLLKAMPEDMQQQSLIDMMVAEALKTFAIEGEYLSREDVLSSIRNNLGLNRIPEKIKDKRAEGVARLMVNVRDTYAAALSVDMLFDWHTMVMEPYLNIRKGQWRQGKEPMQVISGGAGREVIHFEALPSHQVATEMHQFIQWFNQTAPDAEQSIFHAPVRSAIAHLYFESIHPFEDGNGRMGRAISEKALSQGIGRPILLSLSSTIESKRQDYYDALKTAQRSNEITPWIRYFLYTILEAQQQAERQINFTIYKTHYFDRFRSQLNPRQEKVLRRMFEAGPNGFEGGMSTKKYMSIAKTSKASASRDLSSLTAMGALTIIG
ncbi:MAG: DUF4172 domain-containing protein, partial [Bacteroidota bacterium]